MAEFNTEELNRLKGIAEEKRIAKESLARQVAELEAQINAVDLESADVNGKIAEVEAELARRNHLCARLQGVAFRNAHGKLATACPDGRLNWDQTNRNAWENFSAELHGDKFALRGAHGKYLCAEGDGRWTVSRDAVGDWERFEVILHDDVNQDSWRCSFKSCHGKFMCAHPNDNKTTSADNLLDWEKYTVLN